MEPPTDTSLLAQLRRLPGAQPLLERLPSEPGIYLVGGAVRDLLLGTASPDLDVVVEGDAVELARRLGGEIRAHGRFNTCTVALDGFSYDIAGARRERYARPGALPDVEPAPLAEDLVRRDFTVNTFALALNGSDPGALQSVATARQDLDARLLRTLHEQSFIDDPTRLLRLARYMGRLGFEPSADTERLAKQAVAGGALATVSGERIGTELRLLALEPDPLAAFRALSRLGLDRALHAEFGLDDEDLASAALELLPAAGRRDRLLLAVALRRLPHSAVDDFLRRLAFTAPDREAILATATEAQTAATALEGTRTPSEIAAAVAGAPEELVALAGALGPREQAAQWLERLRDVRLAITGDDLLAAGIAPGPAIGQGLRAALGAKLDGRAAGREDELACALEAARAAERTH